MSKPFLYRLYVLGTGLALPFVARSVLKKLKNADVSDQRAQEKLGIASQARPNNGPLIWFHGASVGESLSVLALIEVMGRKLSDTHFLMTSGTATSAELISKRLPPRTVHQFAPLDGSKPVKRFLKHWHPDAAVFVESELWPQLLRRTYSGGVRMALVNARLSEKSINSWKKRPALSRYITEVFDLILTQNEVMAHAMAEMGAPKDRIEKGFNLKSLSSPLPIDQKALSKARAALQDRPVWVASSTHEGEEEIVLKAHKRVLAHDPNTCLILVPRHPERGDSLEALIKSEGLTHSRRSAGGLPEKQVYLADTLGELGTWYALGKIVFLGGSLKPIGGHNPFEVAQAGAAILAGPHFANFAEDYANLAKANAVKHVDSADDLAQHVINFLSDSSYLQSYQRASEKFANSSQTALDDIADRLISRLDLQ